MTDHDTIFDRTTQVLIDDQADSGFISVAVSGLVDPEATLAVAYDEVLNVVTVAVEHFGEESKEVTIDADAFFILMLAITRENAEDTEALKTND